MAIQQSALPELCRWYGWWLFLNFLMEIQVLMVMLTTGVFSGLNMTMKILTISAISDGMLVGSVSVYGISNGSFVGVMTLQLELLMV